MCLRAIRVTAVAEVFPSHTKWP